jgi:hypothetical protein
MSELRSVESEGGILFVGSQHNLIANEVDTTWYVKCDIALRETEFRSFTLHLVDYVIHTTIAQ